MLVSLMNCFKQGMIRFLTESIHYICDMIQKKSEIIKMVQKLFESIQPLCHTIQLKSESNATFLKHMKCNFLKRNKLNHFVLK